jgi:hypothetical protein
MQIRAQAKITRRATLYEYLRPIWKISMRWLVEAFMKADSRATLWNSEEAGFFELRFKC